MILVKWFKRLMGWCPIEDFIKKEWRENSCFSFELEKWSQQIPSPASLQDDKILKAHVSLSRDGGIVKITSILFLILILMIYLHDL